MRQAAVVLILASFARAEPPADEARKHFEAGKAALAADRLDDALAELTAAEQALPSPALDYDLGLVHEKLGHAGLALARYRKVLAEQPYADNRAEIEERVRRLSPGDAKRQQGSLPAGVPGGGTPPGAVESLPPPPPGAAPPPGPPPAPSFAPPPGELGVPGGGPLPPPPPVAEEAPSPSLARQWWFWASIAAVVGAVTAVAIVTSERETGAGPPRPAVSVEMP